MSRSKKIGGVHLHHVVIAIIYTIICRKAQRLLGAAHKVMSVKCDGRSTQKRNIRQVIPGGT